MAQYLINGDILTDIANSIRSGKGTTNGIYPTEFAKEIEAYINCFKGVIDKSIIHLDIPYGIKKLGNRSFMYLDKVETINIPESVEIIGDNTFNSSTKFPYIFIPKSVTEIQSGAFAWCFGCKEFDFSSYEREEENPTLGIPTLGTDVFAKVFDMQSVPGVITVPTNLYSDWVASGNWASWRPYIAAKGKAKLSNVTIDDIWAYGSGNYTFAEAEQVFGYYQINDESPVSFNFDNKAFDQLYVAQMFDEGMMWFYITCGKDTVTLPKVGTYKFWVQDGNGKKHYQSILEVS